MITERNTEDGALRHLSETIQSDIETARSAAKDYEHELQSIIRERPVVAVLAALGLGFAVARIFSGR